MKSPAMRAMAAQLWQDGVPLVDIANLCAIRVTTLCNWRTRYEWPRRPRGQSQLPEWEAIYRSRGGRRCA